jgi:hypothetical protein
MNPNPDLQHWFKAFNKLKQKLNSTVTSMPSEYTVPVPVQLDLRIKLLVKQD